MGASFSIFRANVSCPRVYHAPRVQPLDFDPYIPPGYFSRAALYQYSVRSPTRRRRAVVNDGGTSRSKEDELKDFSGKERDRGLETVVEECDQNGDEDEDENEEERAAETEGRGEAIDSARGWADIEVGAWNGGWRPLTYYEILCHAQGIPVDGRGQADMERWMEYRWERDRE